MSGDSSTEGQAASRVVEAVRRLAEEAAERRATVLTRHDLDQGQLDVLEALRRVGDPFRLTAGELSRACRVTAGATSQRLAVLERSGLVERVREEPDRRTVHVQLTASGRAKVDAVSGPVAAADASMVSGLGRAARVTLETSLAAWSSSLRLPGAEPVSERR